MIGGLRPTHWKPFDYSVPFARRLEDVVGWLGRPPAERPAVVAFYLEEVNGAGHRFGPESPEVAAAVRAGARVRWTDLRMTLASHPQPVPAVGILLSNWEI